MEVPRPVQVVFPVRILQPGKLVLRPLRLQRFVQLLLVTHGKAFHRKSLWLRSSVNFERTKGKLAPDDGFIHVG